MKYHIFEFVREPISREEIYQVERFSGSDIDRYFKSSTEKILSKYLKYKLVGKVQK